jgi:EmrB/QacA subfamily drug resistance transporter
MITTPLEASVLATRRGKFTLLFVCAVAFLDFVDASIVNVALPSIRHDLNFSVQNLQWVLSGYLLTYGGFLLLGGRSADLLGRRRVLVAGISIFAVSSLMGGLAPSAGVLIGARLIQGFGAALMLPAALSILTTTFSEGTDRLKALGVWGAVAGIASAVGVLLGGILAQELGWRWVLFVNLPLCVILLIASFRVVSGERRTASLAHFDALGAATVTGGMLLLIYTLIRVPAVGWGNARTIGGLAGSAVLLVAFLVNEQRHLRPLLPLSIFRIKGLGAADATQVISMAGFYSMFFFVTLYMQNVLHFSPIRAGVSYIPVTLGVAASAGISSKLFERVGTRPIIVGGALVAASGVYWLSNIPVDGTYLSNLLPGLMVMSFGLGAVFTGVTTAANAGVPPDKAGLAAGLVNTSQWFGAALGLAIFSSIATNRTNQLLTSHVAKSLALTEGFHRALLASSIFLLGAAVIALRATNTRGEPVSSVEEEEPYDEPWEPVLEPEGA